VPHQTIPHASLFIVPDAWDILQLRTQGNKETITELWPREKKVEKVKEGPGTARDFGKYVAFLVRKLSTQ
jgi:hypothetical protein